MIQAGQLSGNKRSYTLQLFSYVLNRPAFNKYDTIKRTLTKDPLNILMGKK
jgi:hypothetical protein